jgi:hypothetical protein
VPTLLEFLSPDQVELLLDLQNQTVLEAAGRRGLQERTVRYRVEQIAVAVTAAGGRPGPILHLLRCGRHREAAWTELHGRDRTALFGLFGEVDLARPVTTWRKIRAAHRGGGRHA